MRSLQPLFLDKGTKQPALLTLLHERTEITPESMRQLETIAFANVANQREGKRNWAIRLCSRCTWRNLHLRIVLIESNTCQAVLLLTPEASWGDSVVWYFLCDPWWGQAFIPLEPLCDGQSPCCPNNELSSLLPLNPCLHCHALHKSWRACEMQHWIISSSARWEVRFG